MAKEKEKKLVPGYLYGYKAKNTDLSKIRVESEVEYKALLKRGWSEFAKPDKNKIVEPEPKPEENKPEPKKEK